MIWSFYSRRPSKNTRLRQAEKEREVMLFRALDLVGTCVRQLPSWSLPATFKAHGPLACVERNRIWLVLCIPWLRGAQRDHYSCAVCKFERNKTVGEERNNRTSLHKTGRYGFLIVSNTFRLTHKSWQKKVGNRRSNFFFFFFEGIDEL